MPDGPPILCAADGEPVGAAGGEVDRQLTDGLDRVGVHRDAVLARDRGEFAHGWTVPTSLLAHITVTSATSRVARDGLAHAPGCTRP